MATIEYDELRNALIELETDIKLYRELKARLERENLPSINIDNSIEWLEVSKNSIKKILAKKNSK